MESEISNMATDIEKMDDKLTAVQVKLDRLTYLIIALAVAGGVINEKTVSVFHNLMS